MLLNSFPRRSAFNCTLQLCLLLLPVWSWAQFDLPEVNVIYERPDGPIGFFDGDGDGDMDLLCLASTACGNLLFYENLDGEGTFGDAQFSGDTTWWNYPLLRNFQDPVFADFDQDGDLDVVSSRRAHHSHPFWVNDGHGQFSNPLTSAETTPISNFPTVFLGHFNTDDQADILVFDRTSEVIGINYSGQEGYSFQTLDSLPPTIFPGSVRIIDVNNDSLDDILLFFVGTAGEEYAVTVWPLINDGDEFIRTPNQSVASARFRTIPQSYTIQTADFTGDGLTDISWAVRGIWAEDPAEVEREYSTLLILKNQNGSGVFHQIAREKYLIDQTPVDIESNGYSELIASEHDIASSTGNNVIAYHHLRFDGDTSLTKTFIDSTDSNDPRLLTADLNHDLLPDFVTYEQGFLKWRKGQIDLDAPFADVQTIVTGTPFFQPLGTVFGRSFWDWDSDGDLDIIIPAQKTETGEDFILQVYVLINADGEGNYDPPFLLWESNIVPSSPLINMPDLNGDGWPDFFILSTSNTGENGELVREGVIALSNHTDTTYNAHFLTDSDLFNFAELQLDDLDNDGDLDGLVLQADGNISAVWNELSDGNGFGITTDFILGPEGVEGFSNFCLEDFDQDGEPDLLLNTQNLPGLYWALQLDGAGTFESWQSLPGNPFVIGNIPFSPIRGDFDGDGDIDLHLFSLLSGTHFIAYFDGELKTFRRLLPYYFEPGQHFSPSSPVVDINQDGAMDLYTSRGIMLSTPGTGYPLEPYLPTPDGELPDDILAGQPLIGNVDTDDRLEVVTDDNFNLYWYNLDFIPNRSVQGFVRFDTTTSCNYSDQLPPLAGWLVALDQDSLPQLTYSNQVGYYGALLNDSLDYTLRAIPPSAYWQVCTPDTLLTALGTAGVDTIHFLAQAVTDCAILQVDLSTSPVRQCFNSTVGIHYQNVGTAVLPNASITLAFDQRFTPLSASIPWTTATDTSLLFDLSDVSIGGTGNIEVLLSPDCAALELGELVCFTTQVLPDSLCQDPLLGWDGANLEAYSYCESDSLAFVITNTGNGGMATPEPVELSTIINDDFVIFLMDETQLGPGEADTIRAPLYPEILRLHVDQPPGHPYPEAIDLLGANCEENTDTIVLLLINLPNTQGDPFFNTYCAEVIGPYDPNLKAALPQGINEEMHWIERDWRITYTIHFQNTGTDMARNVYLRDTLSPWLDWANFRLGASSDPVEVQHLPNGEVLFTFSNINLPDSTSNEVESHGFASFSIQPRADVPLGSRIFNRAGIYFDFNPPIITEEIFHTIRKPVTGSVQEVRICAGDTYLGTPILRDTLLEEIFSLPEQDSVVLHYVSVYPKSFVDTLVTLEVPTYYNMTYVLGDTSFAEVLTNQFGCDSVVWITVDPLTDTDELPGAFKVQAYPNPSSDYVMVTWLDTDISLTAIQLYEVSGKLLREFPIPDLESAMELDLTSLSSGNYLLKISTTKGKRIINITKT